MRKLFTAAAIGLSALGLSACATGGLPTTVTRYQAMPATANQSFAIVAQDPALANTLEFERYATLVGQAMKDEGYAMAASPEDATMLVKLGYGVDEGKYEFYRDSFDDPFFHGRYGGYDRFQPRYRLVRHNGRLIYVPVRSHYGFGYRDRSYYYGWNDPFRCRFDCGSLRRVKVHQSFVDVDIRRKSDDKQLFDGQAMARSRTGNLGELVPSLVSAVFHDFPGKSGETVKITVTDEETKAKK